MMGHFINVLAKKKESTISDLCEITGYNQNQCYTLLRGGLLPSLDTLYQLAEYFDVTVNELMDGDKESYARACLYENNFIHEQHKEMLLNIIEHYVCLREKTIGWQE